jgi:hypothetical protein
MNEEKQKSYVPAGLAAIAAIWLGVNQKGSLLTDIAHESIGKVLYGNEKKKPVKSPKPSKKSKSRGTTKRPGA